MRASKYDIDKQFLERFSPKKFIDKEIKEKDLMALIEAASTAPSCFNEQPWVFVLGKKEDFLSILVEANALWAKNASELLLVCSRATFNRNEKQNSWHGFDSGTAMGYMILEALKRNIYVHAMGGFDTNKASEVFELEYLIPHAVLALGYSDETYLMTERNTLDDIIIDRRKDF